MRAAACRTVVTGFRELLRAGGRHRDRLAQARRGNRRASGAPGSAGGMDEAEKPGWARFCGAAAGCGMPLNRAAPADQITFGRELGTVIAGA